jgi:hypothetical protein
MIRTTFQAEAQAVLRNRARAASGCGAREKYRHEKLARESEWLLRAYADAIMAGHTSATSRVVGRFEA